MNKGDLQLELTKEINSEQAIYIGELRNRLTQEKQRREDAEKTLEFYANKDNWSENGEQMAIQRISPEDLDRNYFGGKRAREHFEKYSD